MTFSFKRIQAIFLKDWKDLYKNSYMIFTLAMPLVLAAWLGREGIDDIGLQLMPITLAIVIAGCFVQAAMVAEEKEKNTLRGLILSPASTMEILVGKSALTAMLTVVVIIGSAYFSNIKIPQIGLFSLLILLSLVIFIAIGTTLGLVSRTVMETTIVGMPVMIIFGMSSLFRTMIENEAILKVLSFLPDNQLSKAWLELNNGGGITTIGGSLLILLAWCIVTLVVTFIIYGRRRFDK
ncbi:ABC transporter permease [Fredinandcohnia quinoae]|uniref:ABC transporter permease n=1 Tax=Fredinandcohnia quinoae TaxID=2918902 RepID=A0AAW5E6Q2_9BACI|nr:ABC transporter permease [Fredinandcohnia sp. SECRCQ15]MCH1625300.1 ABC transporter permease [Fredinandcohnia sp. SECRCQ15]